MNTPFKKYFSRSSTPLRMATFPHFIYICTQDMFEAGLCSTKPGYDPKCDETFIHRQSSIKIVCFIITPSSHFLVNYSFYVVPSSEETSL